MNQASTIYGSYIYSTGPYYIKVLDLETLKWNLMDVFVIYQQFTLNDLQFLLQVLH